MILHIHSTAMRCTCQFPVLAASVGDNRTPHEDEINGFIFDAASVLKNGAMPAAPKV
jgi:hypothetical protein